MIRKITIILMLMMAFPATQVAGKKLFTLVIDAGHGGKDGGALGKRLKEKNINLNVALAFGRYVEQNCPDVKVIYTRKTDVFVPLHERAAIANRNKADVFISVHTNSVASRQPISGLETYTMGVRRSDEKLSAAMRENDVVLIESDYKQHYAGFDPRSPESYIIFEVMNDANMLESVELAKGIQKHVCRTANRPNKGVKQDAFLVLRETSMPACLIELGYITTASEEAYLGDPHNVDRLGRGIYEAFIEYKAKHGGGKSPSLAPVKTSTPSVSHERDTVEKNRQETEEPVARKTPELHVSSEVRQEITESGNAPSEQRSVASSDSHGAPVFKVQILTSDRRLSAGDKRFKGLAGVDAYKEGGIWKYTVGSSSNYNEIRNLRKSILAKFPQAFIIAFKNQEKMDTQTAIQEYKSKK